MALITCRKCGGQISDKAKFCVHCGEPVQHRLTRCPSCKATVNGTSNYCSNCGYALTLKESSGISMNTIKVQHQQSAGKEHSSNKQNSRKPVWPIIILSTAIVALVGFLGYGIIGFLDIDINPIKKETATPVDNSVFSENVQKQDSTVLESSGSSSDVENKEFYELSVTEIAFNEAREIRGSEQLSSGNLSYTSNKFNDGTSVIIDKSDLSYYTLNHYFIDDSALYNAWTSKAALIVKNWKDEKIYEQSVVRATIGEIPNESRTSRLERLSKFCEQMPPKIDDMELLEYLAENGAISILRKDDTDIEYDILDFKKSAKTLEISERMLGYVIAYIGGSGSGTSVKATFDENSAHISMHKLEPVDVPPVVHTVTMPAS